MDSAQMIPEIEIVEMTVADAADAFARGVTSEALTQAFLDRIAVHNPHYNALIVMNPEALSDARASDARRIAGTTLGPLDGIPVVIKDPMDMAGLPTTAGWHFLSAKAGGVDLIPETDSPVVARMRAAGCVMLGKTNVPVLSATGSHANDSWAGPTLNSAAPNSLPGGSSAGTATAVGASFAVLGLAEETGGSIQNPASAQGLVGIKPTFALVPNAGVVPLAGSTRDVVGPIARCVRDAALTLDVLAGYTPADPKTVAGIGRRPKGGYTSKLSTDALRSKRLGLFGPGWRDLPLSDEATALYARAQGEIAACGATLIADPFAGSGFADLGEPTPGLNHFDARGMESVAYDLQLYLTRLGPSAALRDVDAFAEATKAEDAFAPGGVLHYLHAIRAFAPILADPSAPPDLSSFLTVREAYLAIFERVMDEHGLDGLVFPQMRDELPPLHGGRAINETTVCEINIAGLPGVTVPAGFYASDAPFNLIFVGRMWSEADLLGYAYAYEAATHHRLAPTLEAAG
ncbi:amidase [Methylobacterium sp. E-025]|jgi:Asp-tRNA(Asn)/Glu-tRNA(Gln) amidotransferase A subunit family amidase|uniref:amidase n=1 Tax=unclassified Methylobacterium TaxID=2615210 RepID=UPI0011C94223|nr:MULTISPECIES: amidase [unclassified Methylobacterium]MCJ2076343.1 amidase [Methylobacterium sp. E-016]MCJ2113565.1 amidase [Methylobacterium sp. E-025]TXM93034.1 amidase [Methylobacterium sp. WL116]